MKSAGKARNNGLYRHIRTSKEIIRNLLNDYKKNFESVSNSMLTLVDCKSTESKSSIDFLLTDGKQYYIITAKRFFIWNRYDLSQLMPFSEETSYSYTDCFTKVNVVQSGNTLCLYEEGYVQPYILSFLFLCVVLMLNILGDKSTPEE